MDAADPLVRVIHRAPDDSHARPNLDDYDAVRASFTWDQAQEWLGGEANLGDQRWHYRVPFFGRIVFRRGAG